MRRSGANPPQQPHSAATADHVSSASASSSPSDLLDFGMESAAVSDDHRRAIMRDLEKLEHDKTAVDKSIATERKTEQELLKDQGHAGKENASILRGSIQLNDQLKMNDEMLRNVESTISSEIQVLLVNTNHSAERQANDDNDGTNATATAAPPTTKPLYVSRKKAAVIADTFHACFVSCQSSLAEHKRLLQEKANLMTELDVYSKEAKDLEIKVATLEEENMTRRNEADDEKKRLSSLQMTLDGCKKEEMAANAKVQELKAKLAAKKAAHASERAAKEKEIADAKALLVSGKNKVKDMDAAIIKFVARNETFVGEIASYKKFKSEGDGHKDATDKARAARNDLFTKKEQIGAALASSKKDLEQQLKDIHDLETILEEEIEAMKAANDNLEVDNVGKESEYKSLLEMLEGFRTLIKSFEETEEKKTLEEETGQAKKVLIEIEAKIETFKKELEGAEAELAKVRDEKEPYESAAQKIKELIGEAQILEKDMKDINDETASKRAEVDALIGTFRELEIYREGAAMIKKTTKTEAELEKNPTMEPSFV